MREFQIIEGDVIEQLKELPAESVHCVVTSPPYWGLRCYGVDGQLGLEKTPEEYLEKMVAVFGEVRRVMRKDATLWLNMGDTRSTPTKGSGGTSQKQDRNKGSRFDVPVLRSGLKPKDLVGMSWRLALALQADGWWLRSDIIWAKPNPMPEPVTDRPTKSHEHVFLMTCAASYFYDVDAIREEHGPLKKPGPNALRGQTKIRSRGNLQTITEQSYHPNGRNRRDVWEIPEDEWSQFQSWRAEQVRQRPDVWKIPTQGFPGAHLATFPEKLVEPCILAGTSEEGCCPKCGAGWKRITKVTQEKIGTGTCGGRGSFRPDDIWPAFTGKDRTCKNVETLGWQPGCECGEKEKEMCTVLDPFSGSGTTGVVALRHGRRYIGIELKPEYVAMSRRRIREAAPLFNTEVA